MSAIRPVEEVVLDGTSQCRAEEFRNVRGGIDRKIRLHSEPRFQRLRGATVIDGSLASNGCGAMPSQPKK